MILRSFVFYKTFSFLVAGILIFIIFLDTFVRQTQTEKLLSSNKQSPSNIFAKSIWQQGRLLNLTDFEFLIENKICSAYKQEMLAVMIVTSAASHVELRAAHRQAITQKRLSELGIQRVFILAAIPTEEKLIAQYQLLKEQENYGDLLQGNFNDAYRNLSYKHTMGLQWAATECNKASFIIKLDDDIVHDIFRIKRFLENLEETNSKFATSAEFLAGVLWVNMPVLRDKTSKWYVAEEEFAPKVYPPYLSGWLYITNPPTALRLVDQSKKVPMLWVDDAWITGVLRESLGIPIMELNSWVTFNKALLNCCIHDLKYFNLECEFYMGSLYGNSTLLVEFVHNFEKCYYYKCVKRTEEQKLEDNCAEN